MKRFNRFLAIAGIAALTAAVPMTSYGFGWEKRKETVAAAETETTYVFKTDKATIAIGAEAAPVIKALGTPKSTFEQDSCAYQGKDKVYMYEGFEISTYPVNGKETISSVYLTDNTVATPEGIKIGSKKQDVIDAYGKDYKEEFGVYRYTAGTTELAVYTTTKGLVEAIEYLIIVK